VTERESSGLEKGADAVQHTARLLANVTSDHLSC
jgi:hypothetical protein